MKTAVRFILITLAAIGFAHFVQAAETACTTRAEATKAVLAIGQKATGQVPKHQSFSGPEAAILVAAAEKDGVEDVTGANRVDIFGPVGIDDQDRTVAIVLFSKGNCVLTGIVTPKDGLDRGLRQLFGNRT